MKQRKRLGICENFGACTIADKKEKIPFDDGNCPNPECGLPLNEIIPPDYALLKKGGLASILVLVLGGGGWYLLSSESDSILECGETPNGCVPQSSEMPEPPEEPKPIEESAKLRQEVDELKDKIEKLEKMGEETAELKARLTKLENDLKTKDDEPETVFDLKEQIAKLDEAVTQKLAKSVPECLSSASPEIKQQLQIKQQLPVLLVPTMQERSVPYDLHNWIKGMNYATVNEPAFFIMRREVTVGEFEDYFKTLNDSQKEKLGKEWLQAKDKPVASIPWEAARDYADWLSLKTGCSLALPTYNQWVAAVIRYAKPREAVLRETSMLEAQPRTEDELNSVLDLLGNVREWSINGCGEGSYLIFGGDYKTWRDNVKGEPICESSTLDTIGFRLVLQEQE
jgi:uncharacterized protein YoxC